MFFYRTFASVKLVCPAGEARPGGALAQSLGPHHVKPTEFALEFNKLTLPNFVLGLPLGCRLNVSGGGKFTLKVCPPSFSTLILGAQQNLSSQEIWWILTYRQGGQPQPQDARTLFGTLKSFQRSVLY